MRLLTIILLTIAAVRITELDIAIAQVDAWANMIQDRSHSGLYSAVESTFSGNEPCDKCLSLQDERKERESSSTFDAKLDKLKLPLPPAEELAAFLPPTIFESIPFDRTLETLHVFCLDTPPPELG